MPAPLHPQVEDCFAVNERALVCRSLPMPAGLECRSNLPIIVRVAENEKCFAAHFFETVELENGGNQTPKRAIVVESGLRRGSGSASRLATPS
jgi:hypothetical protein